jgi:hypothetical protein
MDLDLGQAKEFLNLLFGDPVIQEESLAIVIWSVPSKLSYSFSNIEDAAKKAIELSEGKEDVYVGMGLQKTPKKQARKTRGKAKDVQGIACLWADIDIDEKHVPDEKSARALADEIGLAPSIVVHSGHGLQCFWLLKSPWLFSDEDEHEQAAEIVRGWVDSLRGIAKSHGWKIDAVHDISRVMRIPGLINYKGDPVAVRVLGSTEKRYGLPEIQSVIRAPGEEEKKERESDAWKKIQVVAREPDKETRRRLQEDIDVLCMNSKDKFSPTWHNHRQFESASEYQQSLANMLLDTDTEDQDIADILFIWREKFPNDDKPEKKFETGYIQRTIQKAKEGIRATKQRDIKQLKAISESMEKTQEEPKSEEEIETKKQQAFEIVSRRLRIDVIGLVKEGINNSFYTLHLKNGKRINIGSTKDLLRVGVVHEQIVEGSMQMPNYTLKRSEWLECVRGMLPFTEERDNPDISQEGLIGGWLPEYLEKASEIDKEVDQKQYQQCLEGCQPFLQNGDAFIHLENFMEFIFKRKNVRKSRPEVIDMLRRMDGKDRKLSFYPEKGKQVQRRYWSVPVRKHT